MLTLQHWTTEIEQWIQSILLLIRSDSMFTVTKQQVADHTDTAVSNNRHRTIQSEEYWHGQCHSDYGKESMT